MRAAVLSCLGFALTCLVLGAEDATGWRLLPISGGGNMTGVCIAPSNPEIWYAYADVGGPYRSDDAGRTWRALHGNMPPALRMKFADHIRTISIDPGDPDRFVFVSGWLTEDVAAGAFVSSDGGRTYRQTLTAKIRGEGSESKRMGKALARNPCRPGELVAVAEGDGIFLSTDAGETWCAVGCRGYNFMDVWYDRTVHGRIYASAANVPSVKTPYGFGLFRSDDNGRSWTRISESAPSEMTQVPGSIELVGIFQNTNGSVVCRSRNAGMTWTPYAEGLPPVKSEDDPTRQGYYQALAFAGDHVLVADWIGRIYRRGPKDGRWTAVPVESMTLANPQTQCALKNECRLKYRRCTCDITVDPADPNHILTVDWFMLWESRDGGRNWLSMGDGIQQVVPFTISCDPNSSQNIVFGLADIGQYSSQDGGVSYHNDPYASGTMSVAWSTKRPGRVYAVGGKTGAQFLISDDAGRNWRMSKGVGMPYFGYVKCGRGVFTVAVDPATDDVCICVAGPIESGQGGIYRSKDGGDTWAWDGKGLPKVSAFYRPEEFWYGGPAGWPAQLVFSPDGSALTFGPVVDQAYRLDRTGNEWSPVDVSCGHGKFACAADPFVPGRFLIAGDHGLTEVLKDGVSRKLPGSEQLGFSVAFDAQMRGLVVAPTVGGAEIRFSRDGGKSWRTLPNGMDVPTGTVYQLVVDRKRLFVLTRGSGVWTRDLTPYLEDEDL